MTRPEAADAYMLTQGSTDFTGPIRATGGNDIIPDGAANIGNNTGGGVGVYGTTNGFNTAGVYGSSSGSGRGVWGVDGSNQIIFAGSTDIGVLGSSSNSGGVALNGSSTGSNGFGVWSHANGTNGIGVHGDTHSSGGYGVEGVNTGGGIGIYGASNGSSDNSPGVWGQNTNGGPAIVGFSPSGDGFSAVTATGTGCFGGASGSGTGVYAFSVGGTGLVAQTGGSGQNAGVFAGNVVVTGSLTVEGAKSAAVRGADGTLKRLYSLESPESWFEDFGKSELKGGTATVPLAADFAGVVHSDDYHVFLTPEGESKGWLYVSKKTPGGFTVQEAGDGSSNISFSYRIVAKRKDIAGTRLEHVEDVPVPSAPTFPTPPETPPVPAPVSPRRPGP